jgi:hypothetical protein
MAGPEIRIDTIAEAAERLCGSAIEIVPSASPFNLKLEGWVLGREGPPPRGVRIVAMDSEYEAGRGPPLVLMGSSLNVARRDIKARFPDVPAAKRSGFKTAISLLGLPLEFRLRVEARFLSPPPVPIAHVEGRRPAVHTGYAPRFQPIMLTTPGRAGSTWMTQLIGSHPQAVAYRPFQYEPRMLDYWLEVVRTISEPYAYAQAIDPDVGDPRAWWAGRSRAQGPLVLDEPAVAQWLEGESVEELAGFVQRRLDGFYSRVAQAQDKTGAVRFVERAHGIREIELAHELYGDARELILMRDPRDLLASRLAFNRKTGLAQFSYDEAGSPEDYARGFMRDEIEGLVRHFRLRGDRAFLVRYEDLVSRPEETLEALFDFAGMDADSETVAAVLDRARARRPERQAHHKTSGSDAASIGRWRSDLPAELQDAGNEAFAAALDAFGYER